MESFVEALVPLVAIICLFVVLPGMVMFFSDRKRRWQQEQTGAVTSDQSRMVTLAERMEKRIEALENILDSESPGWRKKYHEH